MAEHEHFSANKYENANYTIVGIFILFSRKKFMLSWIEHDFFYNLGALHKHIDLLLKLI